MSFEIDSAVIKKAAAGDMGSFEKIVIEYEKTIYNVCHRFFNNAEDAQDAAQEVFIKIYRNLNKYNFKCKLSTWAYRIAVNSCIDILRRKKAEPRTQPLDETFALPAGESPADAVISKDTLKNVGEAIGKLKAEYRAAVVLRDVMGFSYQDISEITGAKSVGTVKSRISRARNSLRFILLTDYKISPDGNTEMCEGGEREEAAKCTAQL